MILNKEAKTPGGETTDTKSVFFSSRRTMGVRV